MKISTVHLFASRNRVSVRKYTESKKHTILNVEKHGHHKFLLLILQLQYVLISMNIQNNVAKHSFFSLFFFCMGTNLIIKKHLITSIRGMTCSLVGAFLISYLLILDRTNWRTSMLTSLLVPYIFFSLPSMLFHFLRGEFGIWVAFIGVVLKLFFPRHFPDWLEMCGSLILLLVVSPGFFAHTLRESWPGVVICLIIGCYLLQEHIRASGGFRNSFTQSHGVSNTVGIILLLSYPIWTMVVHFLH